MRAFALLALLFSSCAAQATVPQGISLGVDLRDVADHAPGQWPDAEAILSDITQRTALYAPGKHFSRGGVTGAWRGREVYGVEIPEPPQVLRDGRIAYMVNVSVGVLTAVKLRKLEVILGRDARGGISVDSVALQQVYDLSRERLHLTASLYHRMAVLRGEASGLLKVYPLAVGMLDEGVTEGSGGRTVVVTPTYASASIRFGSYFSEESRPGLFRNLPFISIVNSRGGVQNIAFHVNTVSGTDVTFLQRGFASSGCMRLRQKDILELHDLLRTTGRIGVDVVARFTDVSLSHPYPLWDEYKRVLNVGTAERPREKRSIPERGTRFLREAEVVHAPPPYERLTFVDGDHLTPEEDAAYSAAPEDLQIPEHGPWAAPVGDDPREFGV